jgi:Carboxypeptidase regulatory-like domain
MKKPAGRHFTWLLVATLLFSFGCLRVPNLWAQTVFGRISGTVTDSSGASVPNARVTLTHEASGIARSVTTDDGGFYIATNLPVGSYAVSAEAHGFQTTRKSDNQLVADGRLTVDLVLTPGAISERIEVTAVAGETVNIVSGEIARVVDGKQVRNLALNGRNYMQLVSIVPGTALLNEDQFSQGIGGGITSQSVNGNRDNTNLLTVDGGFNLDSGSNGSQINNVGIDFVDEVKVQTSNFSAEYGRNSGASINVVTRSGGNAFHGSLFEFIRNDILDARSFFAARREKLRFNDFGWSLGGPIHKNKLFFFSGQEWKYFRRDTSAMRRTLPTRAERRGNFANSTGNLFFPGTQNPVPNRDVSSLITRDGRAIAAVYDEMETLASSYVDQPSGNNAVFQLPNPLDFRQDIVRIDYHPKERHSVYGRYIHDKNDVIDPLGSVLPTTPIARVRPGWSYQLTYTWSIRPTLINEAKGNAAWHGQRRKPAGELWKRETYGFSYPELFSGGLFLGGIPDVSITGFSNFRGPSYLLNSPTTDISFSDNVTWIRGAHSVKTGVILLRNRKDQNGTPPYNGNVTFNPGGNPNTTGNAMADALLGNFRTYAEAEFAPIGFFRFSQTEAFALDSWKVSRKLSLEIGLRYQYGQPIRTQANNITNFDPGRFVPAQAVNVTQTGLIVPNSGNRFNGLIRAGEGVPEQELGRVPNGHSPDVLAVPTGAPRGLYAPLHRFAPRFSFAWSPFDNNRTSLRGGLGLFYDRPSGNTTFPLINTPPFSQSVQLENGNLASPSGGTPAALTPFAGISAIDPRLKTPYTINFSLSVQRELPRGLFVEGAYVGNQGRHLLRQPDINQPPFATLAANAALPSSQRAAVNALRPFLGFSGITMKLSDSTSNYHALQLYTAKRSGDLIFTAGYTWSKVLSDASSESENPEDPFNRKFNYGPATFDRAHVFFATYTYTVPFLGHRMGAAGAILSGWELSGITRFQSGAPFTPVGDTPIGVRRADYVGGSIFPPESEQSVNHFFNPAAFQTAPDGRRGNSGVGILRGPGLSLWDFSIRKSFPLREELKFRFQADFFNAFNRANFRDLITNVSDRSFGSITSAGPGRNIQFGLRLDF